MIFDLAQVLVLERRTWEGKEKDIFRLAVAVVVAEQVGIDEHEHQAMPKIQQEAHCTYFEVPLILKYQRSVKLPGKLVKTKPTFHITSELSNHA